MLCALITLCPYFLYFTRVRKNAFEERLALFRPTRHLSQRREAYMQGMHKYHKYATIMLLVILSFPLIVLILSMFEGDYEKISKVYMAIPNDMKMIILLVFCAYCYGILPHQLCIEAQ